MAIKWSALADKKYLGDWRVESEPDADGTMEVAIFSGHRAEYRARQYAGLMQKADEMGDLLTYIEELEEG